MEKHLETFMDDFPVLGHKLSSKGIEVDRANIKIIEKLSPPISVKEVKKLLGM